MKLVLLEVEPNNPAYRGIERARPSGRYIAHLDEKHPVSEMFFWHVYAVDSYGLLPDPTNTKRLIQVYGELNPPIHFELIEITEKDESPELGTEFMGYDLTTGYHLSLLIGGLRLCGDPKIKLPPDNPMFALKPLLCLAEKFFRPQLNSYGLFNSAETADYCLDCLMAFQKIRPNLFEDDRFIFKTIGLWKVPDE